PAQILILDDISKLLANISRIYFDVFLFQIRAVKGHVFQKFLENRVKAASADVFGGLIHPSCKIRDLLKRLLVELQLSPFGVQQRLILFDQRVLRLLQNANEVFLAERLELHTNREAPLQLWNQIARLGDVKRSRGDEQDVIRANESIAGIHRGPFHNG